MSSQTETSPSQSPSEILKQYWGYDAFRPLQRDAIDCALSGNDSVVVLPTGGGKSLCYQVPALCKSNVAVVVSPLISLMKDQVDGLNASGIAAASINSALSDQEKRLVARSEWPSLRSMKRTVSVRGAMTSGLNTERWAN